MSRRLAGSIFNFPALPEFGQADFERAAQLLRSRAGIVLGAHKRDMAARSLGLQAKKLGMANVGEYLTHLGQSADASGWNDFVNAFTINHTAFFRERHHFDILAEFVRTRKAPVSIWSCAASTGEEAYSIAMTLLETGSDAATGASVMATDIDTCAIARARQGVYTRERIQSVPPEYLKKYFFRGTGVRDGLVSVKPAVRKMVEFGVFNLLEPAWPAEPRYDAIFCRNTMIYFDKPTQVRLLERLEPRLKPGGLLFVGHSENISYITKAFRLRGRTVYVGAREP